MGLACGCRANTFHRLGSTRLKRPGAIPKARAVGSNRKAMAMHRSFGIETRPSAKATWKQVAKGPSLQRVREHLRKIANYHKMFG
jgi:hypothetical protein